MWDGSSSPRKGSTPATTPRHARAVQLLTGSRDRRNAIAASQLWSGESVYDDDRDGWGRAVQASTCKGIRPHQVVVRQAPPGQDEHDHSCEREVGPPPARSCELSLAA